MKQTKSFLQHIQPTDKYNFDNISNMSTKGFMLNIEYTDGTSKSIFNPSGKQLVSDFQEYQVKQNFTKEGIELSDKHLDLKYLSVNEHTNTINVGMLVDGKIDNSVIHYGDNDKSGLVWGDLFSEGFSEVNTSLSKDTIINKLLDISSSDFVRDSLLDFIHKADTVNDNFTSILSNTQNNSTEYFVWSGDNNHQLSLVGGVVEYNQQFTNYHDYNYPLA